jgi:spore germination protein KB
MQKHHVYTIEMFYIIILFELGSAVLLDVGKSAKQDAWIAILIGTAVAILPLLIYISLYKYAPNLSLIQYLQKLLGKRIGQLVGLFYLAYFLYICSRVLRDFGSLLIVAAYPYTSPFILNTCMMLAVAYIASLGFEVIGRMSMVMIWLILVPFALLTILQLVSGTVHLDYIKPVLAEGWKPILKTIFPGVVTFPFGEMIAFTMLFPFLKEPKHVTKISIGAVVISGFILTVEMLFHLATIGVEAVSHATFPILLTVSLIKIGDFLERLDAFIVIIMVVLGFSKIIVFLYAATRGASQLFGIKEEKQLVYPLGLVVVLSSSFIAPNFAAHIQEGIDYVTYYLHLPFQFGIPFLLFVIMHIKKRKAAHAR